VVLVVAALSGTHVLEVFDELDGFDPLDPPEPEFVLAAETERGAVKMSSGRPSISYANSVSSCLMFSRVYTY
jgi:hypothetical protein